MLLRTCLKTNCLICIMLEPASNRFKRAESQLYLLKETPKKRGKRLEDLIGMLQHDGPPIPIEELCKPVDYRADWEESEKRSR